MSCSLFSRLLRDWHLHTGLRWQVLIFGLISLSFFYWLTFFLYLHSFRMEDSAFGAEFTWHSPCFCASIFPPVTWFTWPVLADSFLSDRFPHFLGFLFFYFAIQHLALHWIFVHFPTSVCVGCVPGFCFSFSASRTGLVTDVKRLVRLVWCFSSCWLSAVSFVHLFAMSR